MIKIELKPLNGIDIENVEKVLSGRSRQSVERLLDKPSEPYSINSAVYDLISFESTLTNLARSDILNFYMDRFRKEQNCAFMMLIHLQLAAATAVKNLFQYKQVIKYLCYF